ncbi:MAG TPA: nucleotide exchange factor GrpE [Candidatus Thermoplasmatota archaeon]|nr:nucleotide exchange factor GrpE [Candidatus Thermoplasmatota archaeon]
MAEPQAPPEPANPSPATPPAASTSAPDPRDAQLADLRALVARARADYDNLQKRVARDAAIERERAKARVLEGLLPVYELAQMAAHQAQAHPSPVSEGVVLLAREFGRLLEREGLVAIADVGAPFDRAVHEAVAEEDVDGIEPGHVSRIVQAGYRLGERVLRFAKVAVQPDARGAPALGDSQGTPSV